ncbi:MAG: MBL fold metallo-hydrolase [bacterium]|nr:MBL fold metallo-hydrolase [bacterium]
METRNIYPGIEMIQVGDFHSCYLIRDESLALVEAPHPAEAQELIQGLAALGVRPQDLKCLITTHIHLDHAGAAGHLARENPNLIVFVHEIGAPHLINPERINQSARRTYGPAIEVIGEMLPIPEAQIHPLTDGDTISLGRTRWEVLHTPGHARYHICLFEEKEKILFSGDALGCLYPGAPLYLVAPAPEYDFELSLKSIARLESLKPEMVVFTHLGPSRDKTVFEECRKQHRLWVKAIEKVLKFTPDADSLEILKMIAEDIPLVKDFPQYSGSYILNIGGIKRYLMKKANPA